MADIAPTDVIGILRADLEDIYTALDYGRGYFSALDLADGYRQAKPVTRPSRTTALMERCADRVEAYLSVGTEEEGE